MIERIMNLFKHRFLLILAFVIGTNFILLSSSAMGAWSFWGEGQGFIDHDHGHKSKPSLFIQTDVSEEHTVYQEFKNLKNGLYLVEFSIQTSLLQMNKNNENLQHFYRTDKKYRYVFSKIKSIGSKTLGNWKTYSYTLKVVNNKAEFWFRLKGIGKAWVDDFKITPHKGEELSIRINDSNIKGITKAVDKGRVKKKKPDLKLLGTSLKVKYKNYKHLDNSIIRNKAWSEYDHLNLKVQNPSSKPVEFSIVLKDNRSTNYWSRLNFTTQLSPGINNLKFQLNQLLGERGSVRHQRTLNLKKLDDLFFVLDQDDKSKGKVKDVIIEKIFLSSNGMLTPSPGMRSFDFTQVSAEKDHDYTSVTSQDIYNEEKGYGFENPKFWRSHNDKYLPISTRHSIGLLKGRFKIKVKPGNYFLHLVSHRLGFWDIPFWKRRKISINGKIVELQTRVTSRDYLKDYFLFESIEPNQLLSPLEQYLGKVLKPKRYFVEASNGFINLDFEGDDSAISLNTLHVWPQDKHENALAYLKKLKEKQIKQFSFLVRKVEFKNSKTRASSISMVPLSFDSISKFTKTPSLLKKFRLNLAKNEIGKTLIQIQNDKVVNELSWTISEFNSGTKKLQGKIEVKKLINGFISKDLNHETYSVMGKYFKTPKENLLKLDVNERRYLLFNFLPAEDIVPGKYKGSIQIKLGTIIKTFEMVINIQNYSLPVVKIPVGFIGSMPLPLNYFGAKDMGKQVLNYQLKAISELARRGFTTFSGLPQVKVISSGKSDLKFDFSLFDSFINTMKQYPQFKKVFTYEGNFPKDFLNESVKPSGMSSDDYHKKLSVILKKKFSSSKPLEIIYSFSDEALGYSNKFERDLKHAKILEKYYPFLKRSGFSHMGKKARVLNKYFDFGFYSYINRPGVKFAKKSKNSWGSYNGAAGALDDPRFAFGLGLYNAEGEGLRQYIDWHLAGISNYPYFDLDGREGDIVMLYPSLSGDLYPSFKFELASLGLNQYRKLQYLKSLKKKSKKLKKWLSSLTRMKSIVGNKEYYLKQPSMLKFSNQLNRYISNLK